MDPEFVKLLSLLLQLYLTIGIMAIGFAIMTGGAKRAERARAVARWFFLRPIELMFIKSWDILISILRLMLGIKRKK